jgi:hypothetical protein
VQSSGRSTWNRLNAGRVERHYHFKGASKAGQSVAVPCASVLIIFSAAPFVSGESVDHPPKGRSWTHEELLIVCNLYVSLPFGQMHARNPIVVRLARALGRTPGSVAMKLVNFASLDPVHQARGVSGLRGVSRTDREVWEEFHKDWATTAYNSEKNLRSLISTEQPASKEEELALSLLQAADRPTDSLATVRIRTMQSFFRRAVLSAYKSSCCITGNPIPGLLVASHILPWSGFPRERINPKNGLCLVAHFDKAFDQGLITFGKDMRLRLSSKLRAYLPNDAVENQFISLEGAPLRMPERYLPDVTFLEYHRETVFRG